MLKGLAIEKFQGDLLDPDQISEAMEGCDVTIHTAANTSLWPTRSEIVWKVNVDGTANVVTAANGDELTITVSDAGVAVGADGASVTLADVPASNGVIHVIDTVILPTSWWSAPTCCRSARPR